MHAVAKAVAPHFTFGAVVGFHPFAVAIFFKTVLPHIPKAIVVDVSLVVVAADAETARDGAVGEHRGNVDAGTA